MANIHIVEYDGGVLVSYSSKVSKGRIVVDIRDGVKLDVDVHPIGTVGPTSNIYHHVPDYCREIEAKRLAKK